MEQKSFLERLEGLSEFKIQEPRPEVLDEIKAYSFNDWGDFDQSWDQFGNWDQAAEEQK